MSCASLTGHCVNSLACQHSRSGCMYIDLPKAPKKRGVVTRPPAPEARACIDPAACARHGCTWWRSKEGPPLCGGAPTPDEARLLHEFTATRPSVAPESAPVLTCTHCGLEAWSRRAEQECPARLRLALDEARNTPIPMLLSCPACGLQHIDAPDERTPDWTNPPHKSHLCHGCGHIWRPADVPTEGVAAIKTRGTKDSPAPSRTPTEPRPLDAEEKAAREACRVFFETADPLPGNALTDMPAHLRAVLCLLDEARAENAALRARLDAYFVVVGAARRLLSFMSPRARRPEVAALRAALARLSETP